MDGRPWITPPHRPLRTRRWVCRAPGA
jgi:hypothetical protein